MTSTRRAGRPPKSPEARTPLRGRGRTLEVPVAPVDQAHGALLRELRRTGCPPLLLTAAADATWLRPADGPALVVAAMILRQLGPGALEAQPDEVGTLPAFPVPAAPDPGALRNLAPLLVGLLTGLGMMPEARARLGILLVEGDEPDVPAPARMPRSARDRAPAAA